MSFAARNPAQAYAKVSMEIGVAEADPHRLILMLFDGALLAIAKAANALQEDRIADKGRGIAQAMDIVANGLRASLNFSAGDELAERLAALYDYMASRLLHANLHNDPSALSEVSGLLKEIRSAWEEIANDPAAASRNKRAA